MMIPLGILSIITVMLIIVFFFSARRGAMVSGRFMQTADALIRKRITSGCWRFPTGTMRASPA